MFSESKVTIPSGVDVSLENSILTVKGPKGTLERNVWYPGIDIVIDGEIVTIKTELTRKKVTSMVGTLAAHLKNMCKGTSEGYTYTMKVVYSHFPIQTKVVGDKFEIVNFLGEKHPRYARIIDDTKVQINNEQVVITGINKDVVGATAANIERATKVRNRDPRVFQDGIYIVHKE
ncbi:MAG: 50S ribosomal protein L6 [Methanomicrobiales archaeon]|jgi:large subunit ribosomal protein L6|nr:50S ribosomal protein L6 [Methanomicrobiales archaeon]